jgi:hypothetical protein
MSGGLTQTMDNKLLDHINGVAAFTQPTTPLHARLMTATGTATAAGTEVVGGSYAAQAVNFGAASGAVAANTGAVVFTGMPAVTVTGVEIWDSSGTPQRLWWGPLSASKTLNAGDTFQFDAAALAVSLT